MSPVYGRWVMGRLWRLGSLNFRGGPRRLPGRFLDRDLNKCIECSEPIAPVLLEHGALRCHDCLGARTTVVSSTGPGLRGGGRRS